MRPIADTYPTSSFEEWCTRRNSAQPERADDLRDLKAHSGWALARPPQEAHSYRELVELISFYSVMNKRVVPLYRGQGREVEPIPTLSRDAWYLPRDAVADHDQTSVSLAGDLRDHYWNALLAVVSSVRHVLGDFGLPRRRHLSKCPAAVWAVIAHYELWPTPLLDFSTSLHVAASFALGDRSVPREGYVYLCGTSRVRGDLMDLRPPPCGEGDAVEKATGAIAMRLDAVCPPSAVRAHLQNGVLLGTYPFASAGSSYSSAEHSAGPTVIAIVKIIDDGTFWSDERVTTSWMLPGTAQDRLLARFRESYRYPLDELGRLRPPGN